MRVQIPFVTRGLYGTPRTDAAVTLYLRGTTTQVPVYTAATAGSVVGQPLTPDSQGRLPYWTENGGRFDLAVVYGGSYTVRHEWDCVPGIMDAWTAPGLANSWVNYGAGYSVAGYKESPQGVVYLKGLVKSGTVGLPIFTLPSTHRPQETSLFFAQSNGAHGRVDVSSGGAVTLITGSNLWVSLDAISFEAV